MEKKVQNGEKGHSMFTKGEFSAGQNFQKYKNRNKIVSLKP